MKLAVVGSQAISRRQAESAWFLIQGLISVFEPTVVISGGATGIDSVAAKVAEEMGFVLEDLGDIQEAEKSLWIFEPRVRQWDPVGQYGFKARNEDVAQNCEVLVRIAKKDGQATYGSGWTADRAEELGRDVHRYWV